MNNKEVEMDDEENGFQTKTRFPKKETFELESRVATSSRFGMASIPLETVQKINELNRPLKMNGHRFWG